MCSFINHIIAGFIGFSAGAFTALMSRIGIASYMLGRMQGRLGAAYAETRSAGARLRHLESRARLCNADDCPFQNDGERR